MRRLDGIDPVDIIETLEAIDHQLVTLISHDGVDRPHCTDDGLNLTAKTSDDIGDFFHLFASKTMGFGQDHKRKGRLDYPVHGRINRTNYHPGAAPPRPPKSYFMPSRNSCGSSAFAAKLKSFPLKW